MKTLPLFGEAESWEDALEADVHAAGGPKTIGVMLWPQLGPAEGGRKLRRIVNREHKQKLDKREESLIIQAAARQGSRRLVEYYAQLGNARVIPIAPADEMESVVEEFHRIERQLAPLLEQIAAIKKREAAGNVVGAPPARWRNAPEAHEVGS